MPRGSSPLGAFLRFTSRLIVSHLIPLGYRMSGVHAGIKRNASREDCSLVVSDFPAVAAGMYTQNLVFAAPVALDRARTPGTGFRAVAINSGNANACTGERGLADAARMAELGAAVVGASGEQGLVLSTGIIGEFLPLEKVEHGIKLCAEKLGSDQESLELAARGMMTTDTTHKLASAAITTPTGEVRICGMAKGAAMIAPNMGTMLGLVLCDAAISPELAQETLRTAVEATFNCVSVDGHTSTNDTVLLLCNGASGVTIDGATKAEFQKSLTAVCESLARQIPADGEGTTHVIEIHVTGCADIASARQLAKCVADSVLVKCAVHGADPNWGRIVSAAGYAGVPFDPNKVDLHLNGFQLYKQGVPQPFDADLVSHSIRDDRDTKILLTFGEGSAELKYWTADLTAEYVRLNADYHT
jgi:glutamate N-acetyltransferase/amino-acid N-acetyltransferase